MQVDLLDTPIEYLKGIGPKRGKILRDELKISTYYDLLHYFPFRHVDKSKFYKINEIQSDNVYIQLKAKVIKTETIGVGRKMRLVVTVEDDTGSIELIWFAGIRWVKDKFKINSEWVIFGKPTYFKGMYNIAHPEMEPVSEFSLINIDPLQPIYYTSEKMKQHGLGTKQLAKLTKTLIDQVYAVIGENLNKDIINRYKFLSRRDSLKEIHYPKNERNLDKAKERLIFEELFFLQLNILSYKHQRSVSIIGFTFSVVGDNFNYFYSNLLPFKLTNAQKRVIKEIRADMRSGKQMNRLLQGDVGSGKTLVALMCMLIAVDNNFQSCLMAPTEILANQHYNTISKMLGEMDINVGLLTGSSTASERKKLHEELQDGSLHIIIGTHALIEDIVQFKNLGFVVIDEQHRFGVEQRAKLWKKSITPPHVLVMTATPIPRTLAMTLYGDLDVSVIDELPPGRLPIKTIAAFEKDRQKVFRFVKKNIDEKRQAYIVYPIIEESETLDLRNLYEEFENIKQIFPSPKYSIDMLHGKMKPAEKDEAMLKFKNGETNIMVATTVVEVGVDVPNANIMVIENAERFGLSQLHQLRGRVGRGKYQSYCILISDYSKLSSEGRTRIQTMVKSNDGFEIADVDLRLRGPGDLEGTAQSGILELKIANLVRDERMLVVAKNEADKVLLYENGLNNPENINILKHFLLLKKKQKSFSQIS